MSRPIPCRSDGCPEEAAVIIGQTSNGDQTPLCAGHMYAYCAAFIAAVDEDEAAAVAAETEKRLAGVRAPSGPDMFEDDPLIGAEPTGIPSAYAYVEPAKVVRKHTSRSRGEFEARKRAKAARSGQVVAPEPIAPLGPSESVTDSTEAPSESD